MVAAVDPDQRRPPIEVFGGIAGKRAGGVGDLWIPDGAVASVMPAYLPPVPPKSVDRIVRWINRGCPKV
jgi:hypothetical protein